MFCRASASDVAAAAAAAAAAASAAQNQISVFKLVDEKCLHPE